MKAGKIFLVLLLALTVLSCGIPSTARGQLTPAADFKLRDARQDTVSLSSYKDKQPVVLFFWTTWCPLCAKELRIVNQMYGGLVEDGVELLGVNVGELPDRVSNFIKSYHLAFRVLLDRDTEVAFSYGLVGVPTYVFIDKSGDIRFKGNYFNQTKYKELLSK